MITSCSPNNCTFSENANSEFDIARSDRKVHLDGSIELCKTRCTLSWYLCSVAAVLTFIFKEETPYKGQSTNLYDVSEPEKPEYVNILTAEI
jgi:hypothetical protein